MKTWDNGKPRSCGNAFDVLYAPRSQAKVVQRTAPKQRTAREKTIAALSDPVASPFCVAIGTQADSDRTAQIRGRV